MDRHTTPVLYTEEQLLADFSVSHWLKKQIESTKQRDMLDALRDAELLQMVLEQRCRENGLVRDNG